MKTDPDKLKISMFIVAATVAAIFIIRPGYTQQASGHESGRKIVLKIATDDNGTKTVIDTTIEFPDTAMIDSIRHEIEKVIEISKAGKHGYFKYFVDPEGFDYDYDFDLPDPPDVPMDIEELELPEPGLFDPGSGMRDLMWERMARGPERRIIRERGHGQTLSDVLGEIPMDRVISYSIKDHKKGKRIIIDLKDYPMFEKQERVIVIREPGRMPHKRMAPGHRYKVRVHTGDDSKAVETPEPPEAPAPPPPPPPPPPDKTTPKTPKI